MHTLAQLIELNSLPTTAQDAEPAMPFGERVLARLADAGYALRNVADDQGTRCVRQDRSPSRSGSGERLRYRVAIGSIAVARDFDVLDGQTVPRPVQVIEGTRSESRAAVTTVGSRRVGKARGVGTSAASTPTGAFVRDSRRAPALRGAASDHIRVAGRHRVTPAGVGGGRGDSGCATFVIHREPGPDTASSGRDRMTRLFGKLASRIVGRRGTRDAALAIGSMRRSVPAALVESEEAAVSDRESSRMETLRTFLPSVAPDLASVTARCPTSDLSSRRADCRMPLRASARA